jgi:putative transposase
MWWNEKSSVISRRCFIPLKPPTKHGTDSWFTFTKESFPSREFFLDHKNFSEYESRPKPNKKKRKRNHDQKPRKRRKLVPGKEMRTLKVRIYPNKKQKEILKKWVGTSRFIYNKSVDEINKTYNYNKEDKNVTKRSINVFGVINKLIGKNSELVLENPWLLESPSHVKSNSVRDCFKARKTCFSLLKSGKIKKFTLHFRKKRKGGSIVLPKTSVKMEKGGEIIVYKRRKFGKLGNLKTRSKKAKRLISGGLSYDPRILLDSVRKYWILIPYDVKVENQEFDKRKEFVSLDPGVRTFQTFYSPNGIYGEIGKNDFGRIYRLSRHLDDLQSRMTKVKSRKRYRMKKAYRSLINRIKNLVNEVHRKTAVYLTRNFKNIILPKFETSRMVAGKRDGRTIQSKVARGLLTWSHYRFKELLREKCLLTNTKLLIVTEEYTSKTCGKCGNINKSLGGKKIFTCYRCGLKIDRDLNGARNIFLKFSGKDLRGVVINHHSSF